MLLFLDFGFERVVFRLEFFKHRLCLRRTCVNGVILHQKLDVLVDGLLKVAEGLALAAARLNGGSWSLNHVES